MSLGSRCYPTHKYGNSKYSHKPNSGSTTLQHGSCSLLHQADQYQAMSGHPTRHTPNAREVQLNITHNAGESRKSVPLIRKMTFCLTLRDLSSADCDKDNAFKYFSRPPPLETPGLQPILFQIQEWKPGPFFQHDSSWQIIGGKIPSRYHSA